MRLLSRPDFNRVEDAGFIVSDAGDDYTDVIIATRNQKGTYAMVYLPQPKPVEIDLDKLKKGRKRASWFNPVTGKYTKVRKRYRSGVQTFIPPAQEQKDWVLVIDVK